ncbi:tetratricopeptide repeat protein 21B [Aphelenchoides avenae]|nr:tetratricopeptide repeat protein 21B [Aphelenchus avenae]
MTREWERVIEIAQNASLIQIDCSLVQLYECAHVVLVNGEHSYLDQVLNDIYESITKFENTNAFVNYQLARFLYSISVDNTVIAQFAKRFIDKAIFVQKHASYLALKSRLVLAEGDAKTAHQLAMDAVKTSSDSNPDVLFGLESR